MTRLSRALPTASSERVTESGLVSYAAAQGAAASRLTLRDGRWNRDYGVRSACTVDPAARAVAVRAGLTTLFDSTCRTIARRCATGAAAPRIEGAELVVECPSQ